MVRDIPVVAVSRKTKVFLYVMALVFSGFFFYLYVGSTDNLDPDKARAQLPGLLFTLSLLAAAFIGMWWALHRCSVVLTDDELVVRAGFYGRRLARSKLLLDRAEEVSLVDRRDLAPRWRTNGIGLPGFRAGWFRLRNNDRALVLLTDPFQVTHLPTTEGYVLVISTCALLDALRDHRRPGG